MEVSEVGVGMIYSEFRCLGVASDCFVFESSGRYRVKPRIPAANRTPIPVYRLSYPRMYGLDYAGWRRGPTVGFYEHCNELLDVYEVHTGRLLTSVTWSYLCRTCGNSVTSWHRLVCFFQYLAHRMLHLTYQKGESIMRVGDKAVALGVE
jgi:hypothetical protein